MSGLAQLALAQASELIRSGELSPVAYLDALLEGIAARDGQLGAFIALCHASAAEQAALAEEDIRRGHWRGPLHGIPYALKDLIDVEGVPTTAHSRRLAGSVAGRSAHVVRRLDAAGAIHLGKVALDEFACGGASVDCPWPAPKNPWNPAYLTGGSSSGSAVAVAAGFAPFSLGTDTAGSIRHPASRCGCVGMKPTYGRVSNAGVFPLAPTLDTVGPITRTVADNALVLQAIAGHDPSDRASRDVAVPGFLPAAGGSLQGVTLGVVRHPQRDDAHADPQEVAAFERAIDVLRDAGAHIREVALPGFVDCNLVARLLLGVEAFSIHASALREAPAAYGKRTRNRIVQGAFVSAAEYLHAQRVRARYVRELDDVFQGLDGLLTLSNYDGPAAVDSEEALAFAYIRQVRMPFNLSGHPAMVLPTGLHRETGLPLSMQIVGNYFDEAMVYRIGQVYEERGGWNG